MKKTCIWTLLVLSSLAIGRSTAVPEQIENKAFDPKKIPVLDEPKPDMTAAEADWKRAALRKPRACGSGAVWQLLPSSVIEGIATKEKNVAVKGRFTQFIAYSSEKAGALQGPGQLDLSSWNSGMVARDYRVIKYVFAVEKPGRTVLPFEFKIEKWTPADGTWESPVTVNFSFRGLPVRQTFNLKLTADKDRVKAVTAEPQRFTFLNANAMTDFQTFMSLCNHQFMGSFADVAFEAVFKKLCD